MIDCFSLPDAAELVTTLRNHAEYCDMPFSWMNEAYAQAADAIEQLLAENAKLKAERDEYKQKYLSSEADATNLTGLLVQAVADLQKESRFLYGGCHLCGNAHTEICKSCIRDDFYADIADNATDKWEWRGVTHD